MEMLAPPPTRLMSGAEPIAGTDAALSDFWAWALSDLRSNTTRPMLAEFLVARALGVAGAPRIEWHPHDVETADGLRVEVKSGAYLQSWPQRALSRITFGSLNAGLLDETTNSYSAERGYNADVYVFAVLRATEHAAYDALDTASWDFWVAPRNVIASTGQRSLTLRRVEKLAAGPVVYSALAKAIRIAGASNASACR